MNLLCGTHIRLTSEAKEALDGCLLIKKSVYSNALQATNILAAAESEAEQCVNNAKNYAENIVDRAQAECDQLRSRAYEEGLENSSEELNRVYKEFLEVSSKYLDKLNCQIANYIQDAITTIVSEFDDKVIVQNIVNNANNEILKNSTARLWVSPDVYQTLEGGNQFGSNIEVYEDSSLSKNECRLDNGSIVITGSAESQINSMILSLKENLKFVNQKLMTTFPIDPSN